jgi:hypothetical protein
MSGNISVKFTNIKLHENPSGVGRNIPHGRKDVTKLVFAFSDVLQKT